MLTPRLNLRIGVVQLSPKYKIDRASSSESGESTRALQKVWDFKLVGTKGSLADVAGRIQPQSLDLLCFPEMAFTGYAFENSSAILPHLEQPRTGATSLFCAELAKNLGCYVIAGYPERLNSQELDEISKSEADSQPQVTENGAEIHRVGANSAALYGPDGIWVGGYRKSHLFKIDLSWAKAGNGFETFTLPSPIRTMSLGICMDLNPQIPDWTSAEGPYELADYAISNKANVLLLLNAWLDSGKELDEPNDWHTLNYWAARTRPLWTDGKGDVSSDEADHEPDSETAESGDETIVVICNRSGEENGQTFAGTSAIFSMRRGSGRPKLLDMMERKEEGVRIWNIHV